MTKPNILWICSDQQRWDTLGCYGNPFTKTPNLNQLAEDGFLFQNAFCQSPVCTPSRSSFLTGRYPRTTRCRQNGQEIPEDEILVTRILSEAGYVCGLAGKLHLSPCYPPLHGDMERRINDGYSEFHWSHHSQDDWGLNNEYIKWLKEKGVSYGTPWHQESKYVHVGMSAEHHQTTWCAEKAIDFIRSHSDDRQPWLFSINFFDPHHAFDAPKEYLNRYMEFLDDIPLPNYVEGELEGKPWCQAYDHQGAYGHNAGFEYEKMTEKDHRMVRASYWAMCDLIDEQVGRTLNALRETGQLENTIVIYTSDHGEMLGDHGIYLKGPYFYEPAIRVPLIFSCPSLIQSQESPALVELTDIAQTLLDVADIEHHPGMQGKSLWPMLTDNASVEHHRDDIYCEYYNSLTSHKNPTAQMTTVRTDRYKLTVNHSGTDGELYDLYEDPNETVNMWDKPEAKDVKTEMLIRLCNRMAWTVDPLPIRRKPW